jgi:hypothetical protein
MIYSSGFMPSASLPALRRGGFFPIPWQKIGLLTADIREFPIVLGW